jgi:hypothetical protein
MRRVQSESDIAVVDAGPDQESPLEERREKGCVGEERFSALQKPQARGFKGILGP